MHTFLKTLAFCLIILAIYLHAMPTAGSLTIQVTPDSLARAKTICEGLRKQGVLGHQNVYDTMNDYYVLPCHAIL